MRSSSMFWALAPLAAPRRCSFQGLPGSRAGLLSQGLVQEAIVKTIAWSPPAIARLHLPVLAFGLGWPWPIGPGEVVDGDGHPTAFGWLGRERLLGWRGLLGCRRAHPWPSQGAAGQKTEGLSIHHGCILDQLSSLTHKAIARCRMLAALPAVGCLAR